MASLGATLLSLGQQVFAKVDLGVSGALWVRGLLLEEEADAVVFAFVPPRGLAPPGASMKIGDVSLWLAKGARTQVRAEPPRGLALPEVTTPRFKKVFAAYCALDAGEGFLTVSESDPEVDGLRARIRELEETLREQRSRQGAQPATRVTRDQAP